MEEKGKKLPQIIATLAACIGAFSLGNQIGWTSPVMPHLRDCQLNVTNSTEESFCDLGVDYGNTNKASLIEGLFPIGALLSGQVAGFLMSLKGRKWTMISMSIPCIVGCICLVLVEPLKETSPLALLYIGRFFTGIGTGAFSLAVPLYVTEIAERSIQGALGSCMQLSVTLGIAFTSALSIQEAVWWPHLTIICAVFPALMAVAMFFMPESPYFLVTTNRDEEASKSLRWLRGSNYNVERELEELKQTHKEQEATGAISIKELLTKPVYYKPFMMALAVMFFQQFCGINGVLFALEDIFKAANDSLIPGLSSFLVTLVQVLATGVAVMIVDRFGRKILLILSGGFMSVSLIGLAVFFLIKLNECIDSETTPSKSDDLPFCNQTDGSYYPTSTVQSIGWLPLACLIVYIFFFSIGFGPLCWTVNAEIFPREAISRGSSIGASFNWLCAFIVTFNQSSMVNAMGRHGLYFFYAGICAASVAFLIFFLPETKGKSPEDMKAYFEGKKKSKADVGQENDGYEMS